MNHSIIEGALWLLRAAAGAGVFSFLSKAAYCLPGQEHSLSGKSRALACGETLRAGALPACTGGRIQAGRRCLCRIRTSIRYFLPGCVGGIGFAGCGLRFGTGANGLLSLPGLAAFCYLCILFLAARADLETRRIDDRLQEGIVLLALVSLWTGPGHTLSERLVGVFAVSLPMLFLSMAASGAFGGGDIKLMASSGFLLGWRGIIVAMLLGLFTGGCCALLLLLRKKVGRKDHIAFGPFLALGLAAALFWGDQIADWYLFTL